MLWNATNQESEKSNNLTETYQPNTPQVSWKGNSRQFLNVKLEYALLKDRKI